MIQSLFKASKKIYRSGSSGVELVGENNIGFELYTQDDIDANVEAIFKGEATGCTFGDSDESKVVLVAGGTITIPSGFNLTPVSPKKSMVILCNTLVNNGTISMTAKGPNVEPHKWFILSKLDNYGENNDIIIPPYANNSATSTNSICNGNNGTDRNCGSGGSGCFRRTSGGTFKFSTGSGYSFGGGAGTGGLYCNAGSWDPTANLYVDTIYPMRGSRGYGFRADNNRYSYGYGGVGNPPGDAYESRGKISATQNIGVGGRLIIFCGKFENNGIINADGVTPKNNSSSSSATYTYKSSGGPSGGGAIDIFYHDLITEGTIAADGGAAVPSVSGIGASGKGGNGCITLSQWIIDVVVKPEWKSFSRDNWIYLFNNYVENLNESEAL